MALNSFQVIPYESVLSKSFTFVKIYFSHYSVPEYEHYEILDNNVEMFNNCSIINTSINSFALI